MRPGVQIRDSAITVAEATAAAMIVCASVDGRDVEEARLTSATVRTMAVRTEQAAVEAAVLNPEP